MTFFAEMEMTYPSNGYVPAEVIVGFYSQTTSSQIEDVVSSIGGKIISKLNTPKAIITRIKLPDGGPSVDEVIDKLKSVPAFVNIIMYVEPNMARQVM